MSWRRPAPTSLAGALIETVRRLVAIDVVQMSAALAYYSALSLAPLVIITLGITGFIVDRQVMQEHVAATVGALIGTQGADLVRSLGQDERETGAGAMSAALGLAMLLVTASAVFAQLQSGLNAVWGVAAKPRGSLWNFLRTRLISIAMAVCLGFLLLVSMVANAGISALGEQIGTLLGDRAAFALPANLAAILVITTTVFALLFRLLPEARVTWREAWHGALVTALLFQVGVWGIGLYVGHAGVGTAYGAAGSIVVLLVWVFYASLIVFAGAQYARVRTSGAASDAPAAPPAAGSFRTTPAGPGRSP